jgi:adenylate cyclase
VTLEAAPAFDLQTLLSEGAPTVAVLPFRGYGAVADGIGLGDILADQLITHLAHGDEMHVTSRLSTAAFRERPCSLEDVATHLRANYVVSGRYYEHHGRLTVDVEMADAMRRRVVWKHAASEPLDAVLSPDAMLTLELVGGISRAIFAAEIDRQPLVGMPTLSTHSLMLTAIGLMYRLSPKDFLEARRALDALRERLPSHPAPLAWLSRWHLFKLVQNWTTDRNQEGRVAEECAHRALEIDPNSALALTMLGNVRTNHHRDPVGAEALYDQALAINPNESWAWLQKGNALSFRGEGAAAMQHIERAIGLSPLDPAKHFYQSLYAGAALTAGDYERAITAARASLRLNREHVSTFRVLAIGLSMLGREQEARRVVQTLLHIEPDMTVKSFVARSPGRQSGLAERFGEALGAVGLPLGQ